MYRNSVSVIVDGCRKMMPASMFMSEERSTHCVNDSRMAFLMLWHDGGYAVLLQPVLDRNCGLKS